MYDAYQEVALTSRLGIPLIYGVDAVHGHNNVLGATMFRIMLDWVVQMIMNCVEKSLRLPQLKCHLQVLVEL